MRDTKEVSIIIRVLILRDSSIFVLDSQTLLYLVDIP